MVGEVASGSAAVHLAEQLQPNLVLMDLQMPHGDGLSAIRQIAAASPHIHILVVTMFEDDDSVFAAMRAGARGYVLKDMDDDEMMRAIVAVGNGAAIFSPPIAAPRRLCAPATRGWHKQNQSLSRPNRLTH